MNDQPFQADTTPAWLTGKPAAEPNKPAEAWLAADEPHPEDAAETVSVVIQNPDDPEQFITIHKASEEETEAMQSARQIEFQSLEDMIDLVLAFKRFWQWPAGTQEERLSAEDVSQHLLDIFREFRNEP